MAVLIFLKSITEKDISKPSTYFNFFHRRLLTLNMIMIFTVDAFAHWITLSAHPKTLTVLFETFWFPAITGLTDSFRIYVLSWKSKWVLRDNFIYSFRSDRIISSVLAPITKATLHRTPYVPHCTSCPSKNIRSTSSDTCSSGSCSFPAEKESKFLALEHQLVSISTLLQFSPKWHGLIQIFFVLEFDLLQ